MLEARKRRISDWDITSQFQADFGTLLPNSIPPLFYFLCNTFRFGS